MKGCFRFIAMIMVVGLWGWSLPARAEIEPDMHFIENLLVDKGFERAYVQEVFSDPRICYDNDVIIKNLYRPKATAKPAPALQSGLVPAPTVPRRGGPPPPVTPPAPLWPPRPPTPRRHRCRRRRRPAHVCAKPSRPGQSRLPHSRADKATVGRRSLLPLLPVSAQAPNDCQYAAARPIRQVQSLSSTRTSTVSGAHRPASIVSRCRW